MIWLLIKLLLKFAVNLFIYKFLYIGYYFYSQNSLSPFSFHQTTIYTYIRKMYFQSHETIGMID